MNPIKKYVYLMGGSLSLLLGITGVIIPVLPTTPFLLVASFCYLKSSKSMYAWLINQKVLGAYIYSYLTYKAIPRKTKVSSIIFLWSTLIISGMLLSSLHIRLFLVAVGIGVTIHLLLLKTMNQEEIKELNDLYCNIIKEPEISEKKKDIRIGN